MEIFKTIPRLFVKLGALDVAFLKARHNPKLVRKLITVNRGDTRPYQRWAWVLPEEANSGKITIAQGDLFGDDDNENLVETSNGPYKVEKYTKNNDGVRTQKTDPKHLDANGKKLPFEETTFEGRKTVGPPQNTDETVRDIFDMNSARLANYAGSKKYDDIDKFQLAAAKWAYENDKVGRADDVVKEYVNSLQAKQETPPAPKVEKPDFPYRIHGKASNAVQILPAVGKHFTPEQEQYIKKWATANGWKIMSAYGTKTALEAVDEHGKARSLEPYTTKKQQAMHQHSQEFDARQEQRQKEREEYIKNHPIAQWLKKEFGSVTNDYNVVELAKKLSGESNQFYPAAMTPPWLDVFDKLGIKVDKTMPYETIINKIKEAYNRSSAGSGPVGGDGIRKMGVRDFFDIVPTDRFVDNIAAYDDLVDKLKKDAGDWADKTKAQGKPTDILLDYLTSPEGKDWKGYLAKLGRYVM